MRKEKAMQRIYALTVCSLVVFSFGAAGEICGVFFETTERAFGHTFPDNNPEDIRAVLKEIEATPKAKSNLPPIAVLALQSQPRAVEAFNLDTGKKMWRLNAPISSPVTVAGELVLWKTGNQVMAHRLVDGRGAWNYKLDDGWNFYGADADGGILAMSIGVGGLEPGGYANGKIVILNAKNGLTIWKHPAGSGILGKPVVIGKLVFVPWDRQKIVVIDAEEGEEVCRVRAADFSINFLRKSGGALYYGALTTAKNPGALFRFNETAATGTAEGTTGIFPQLKPVPGEPHFGLDAYGLSSGGRSTQEKIRFHYKPAASDIHTIRLEGDTYYLHFWSYIIAFDARTDTVRWTHRSEENIESMAVVNGGGVVAVDSTGAVLFIDPTTGTETWRTKTGETVLSAVFAADSFMPVKATTPAIDPVESLKNLILDRDNRLLPIRAYAVGLLAAIPKPEITHTLLEIYSNPASPQMLRLAVVKAIESRTVGAEFLVSALGMKYDYLEGTRPPPMKIVAPALINMGEKEAVPALIAHLMNHETPAEDLVSIVAALHALGDVSVVEPLTRLLTLYHADIAFLGHEQALASAAYTLLKYGEKEPVEKFISLIRDDSQTLTELKKLLRGVLDPELVAREAAEAKAKEEAAQAAAAEAARLAAEAAFIPDTLTKEQINQTIRQNQAIFAPCIMAALGKSPELRQIRLRFSIAGETGTSSDLKILPSDIEGLHACMKDAFAKVKFRKFKTSRQLATYTISISAPKPVEEE